MKLKHKFYLFLAALLVAGSVLLYFHAGRLWECKSTGWQLGRDTEYSFITGKCAMATGRVDVNGDPVMVIQNNDRGMGGEFEDGSDDSE